MEQTKNTVTPSLRQDVMPHFMRVVETKAKVMLHVSARNVELFFIDDGDVAYRSI